MNNKHYIRIDENKNVIYGYSDAFESYQKGDILINENSGRHFELFGETNPSLVIYPDVYIYKYENGKIEKVVE